jgi:glycosyltransferase involved in cell wall biosynthesis
LTDHSQSVLVSIGLPVYNGEQYLREAIDSILSQTFRGFELIVCDNASTDKTEVICRSYVNHDERIVYYRNSENMGAAYNYNKAFQLSKGEFFKWAAADDVITPEFLDACLSVLVNDPRVVLCYPRTVFIDEIGKEIGEYSDEMELVGDTALARYRQFHTRFRKRDKCNAIFGLVRSSALGSTRLIDRFVSSDIVLLGELALLGKIHEVQQPLFFRRDHPQMSIRAYKAADRSAWFDTKRKLDSQAYVHWRLGKEFFRSIWTIPLKLGTRLGCSLEALKWMGWRRHLLWKEGRSWGLTRLRNLPYPISSLLRSFWRLVNRGTEKTPTSGEGV